MFRTRNLLAPPVRLGGLGLVNPTETSDRFQASMKLTAPLVAFIVSLDVTCQYSIPKITVIILIER